jgi:hypothetical protein
MGATLEETVVISDAFEFADGTEPAAPPHKERPNQRQRPVSASVPAVRPIQHSAEAEEHVIACCFISESGTIEKCLERKLTADAFFTPANRTVYESIAVSFLATGIAPGPELVAEKLNAAGRLGEIGGQAHLMQLSKAVSTTAQVDYFITRLRDLHARRQIIRKASILTERCHDSGTDLGEILDAIHELEVTARAAGSSDSLRFRMEARRFNFATPPAEPEPRFWINAKPVSTPGNLTNLRTQAKTGESAFTGAMLAAVISAAAGRTDRDTLGVTAAAPCGRKLIHIDTEQSVSDHDQHIRRALRRAGTEDGAVMVEVIRTGWILRQRASAGADSRSEGRSGRRWRLCDHSRRDS